MRTPSPLHTHTRTPVCVSKPSNDANINNSLIKAKVTRCRQKDGRSESVKGKDNHTDKDFTARIFIERFLKVDSLSAYKSPNPGFASDLDFVLPFGADIFQKGASL